MNFDCTNLITCKIIILKKQSIVLLIQLIKNNLLFQVDGLAGMVNAEELSNRVKSLELENKSLKKGFVNLNLFFIK